MEEWQPRSTELTWDRCPAQRRQQRGRHDAQTAALKRLRFLFGTARSRRCAGQFALSLAFAEDGKNFIQRGGSHSDLAQQDKEVFARSETGVQIQQHGGDDRDVQMGQHTFPRMADQVREVRVRFEPAKKQFDRPVILPSKARAFI